MNRAKRIASKHLTVLLQDEIFADFFNTFLNLPVFGQTPIFMFSARQWYLWPELPCNQVSKYKGLLNWMEKHRLPYFCKTNLCLHYLLSKELISFIQSPEAAEMLRWRKADQWLLEKCIAGSRGMWRFRAFMQGMAGEELIKFWLAVERILGIDETDEAQQDLYISLIQVLMATHLQEGSTVVTLCNTTTESLLQISGWHPPQVRTRREILSEMQKVALFKLESYWLPNFYIHCKLSMENDPKCFHLLEEYEERLWRAGFPRPMSPPLQMSIRKSSPAALSYCSLKSKKEVWDHITGNICLQKRGKRKKKTKHQKKKKSPNSSPADKKQQFSEKQTSRLSSGETEESSDIDEATISNESPSFKSSPSDFQESPSSNNYPEMSIVTKLRSSTPMVAFPSMLALRTMVASPLSLAFLPWVLIAEKCAGRPFREFLLRRSCSVEVHLLDLWHDLEDFLSMMMCSLGEGNILLRHVMGERICELYLVQSSNWHLPLKLTTLKSLQNLLPSGHVIPWVLKAQKEICQILSFLYEEFLQQDDKMFLFYVGGKEKKPNEEEPYEKGEHLRLIRRITASLHLSQALAGMRDFDLLSGEHWELLGTQDLKAGGSVYMELEPVVHKIDYTNKTFEELTELKPKMAIELLSENFREYCRTCPSGGVFTRPAAIRRSFHWTRSSFSFMRKGPGLRKPLVKPRVLSDVLQSPIQMDYFRQFLKMNNAETLLLFWLAVEELKNDSNLRTQRIRINDCVRTYFYNVIPPEKLLQCEDPIMQEIKKAKLVTVPMLVTAQNCIMKILEERWFKKFQGLYPESDVSILSSSRRSRRGSVIHKMKRCWHVLGGFIRSVCRFRKAMSYVSQRRPFEDFLQRELKNDKENMPPHSSPLPRMVNAPGMRYGPDDLEVVQVRRKIFSNRIILINFLVNDLYFYLEVEKFFHLADSVVVLASLGLYTEKDIAFLRSKVAMINKLFLNSDIPPKLKVNLTDVQNNQIRLLIADGVLNRTLYHGAIISIFPILLYFWKK
ncbi:regulator of G-protein signaling protein-like [Tiliqua scincoides]|uniref:regulator of G-protein signaling protein-like n=1 Tax=Tiliqua scincoides TaxID=71010 RepID=UPI0034630338